MKKINRFIAVLMIFVIALGSLSACGKKETSGDVQNSSSSGESKEGNSDSKNKKDLNSTNTSGDSSDAKDATSDGSSNGGSNDSSADTANPLAKQLQIVVMSDSKAKVTLTSEYLSQLECRDNGDGSESSLNALGISGYDSDYNWIFNLDCTGWGWNFGAGEDMWDTGELNLDNNTASFEISLLGIGTIMKKVSMINMYYNDWHDNPNEPKVLMNEDYSAESVVTEQPMEAILRVSFPQDNRVKFTLDKTAEIETSINDSEYGGSVGIALYPDAAALNGHRSAVSIDLSSSKYEGETDYYANLSATKYTQIDEWSYNQEWIDLDEFGLRVYRIINEDSVAVTATMDDIQSLISACSVYEVYDNYYNTIEIGYLKDVFKNEGYGSFPAEFTDATDAEFGFVPHSDSYRLVSFEAEIDIPTMEWYQEWYDGFCYGNREGSTHTGKVRVVVFWNNDETGYSNMACKLIFDNEKDKKDYLAGIYTTFVYGASEADDSLITDELYTEAIKDAYFEDCYYVGDSGNTAYFESSSYYTESIFDDDYSHDIEVFDLDLWHSVEYAKGEQVSQNATLSIHNPSTYETISRDVSLTSYSTY